MMKKFLAVLLAVLLCALSLAGCAQTSPAEESSPAAEATAEPTAEPTEATRPAAPAEAPKPKKTAARAKKQPEDEAPATAQDTADADAVHFRGIGVDEIAVKTENVPARAAPGQLQRRGDTDGDGSPADGAVVGLFLFRLGERGSRNGDRQSDKTELECFLHFNLSFS